ncbi:MAG: BRO family protein [Sarcina sp.]
MKRLFIESFNGYKITSVIWKGKVCWGAIEIAKFLGYEETSYAIGNCLKVEKFREGIEYELLKGEELKEFKSILGSEMSNSIKYAPKLVIFYEPGLYGFLAYTEKPLGVTFRTWIREEVVPQVRATGAYVLEDDYYNTTYNSDIEFTCVKDSEIVKEEKVSTKVITIDNSLDLPRNDFDVDKFQRLRLATESAKLLKGLLDDVETDSICKLAVVKTLFSESGIELPIYFNKN